MTTNRSIGTMAPRDLPADLLIPFVREAEKQGFDEVWVVEDLGFRGGIAQAAAVLASTDRVRVGIGILPLGARNVAYAAMELGTLEELFPGRVVAGLGHGMPTWMRRVGAWPSSPLALMEEYFVALERLLAGEQGPERGRYARTAGVELATPPSQVPPLLAGVRGPKSLALAGRVARGVVLAEPTTPEYVRSSLRHLGHPERAMVVAYNAAAVDDDAAAARQKIRSAVAVFAEEDWRPHLEVLAFGDEFHRLASAAGSSAELAAALPDEWLDQLAVVGTPMQARARIEGLFDAGATSVVLIPSGPDPYNALVSLGRVLHDGIGNTHRQQGSASHGSIQ